MSGVQSIERAFAILRILALGPAGVTEIADKADLPKSTVSRLLAALETEGAVEQVEDGAEYIIGEGLRTIGGSSGPRATLRAVIRPFLEELSQSTGGSAGFSVRRGHQVYWVDNVDDEDAAVQVADQTGNVLPLHSVASGLALLSTFSAESLNDYCAHMTRRGQSEVLGDPERLRQRLARIGSSGVIVSNEEFDEGVTSMAVPFRGPSGDFEGALYVQGPSFRFPAEGDDARVLALVVEAARAISERFEIH